MIMWLHLAIAKQTLVPPYLQMLILHHSTCEIWDILFVNLKMSKVGNTTRVCELCEFL